MPEPLEDCEHCEGTGELPLLGPNTTSCPCLERTTTGEDLVLDEWTELVWEPVRDEAYTHPPGLDVLCFPDNGKESGLAFRYIGQEQWQWVCSSECEDCNGKSSTVTTFSLEDIVEVLLGSSEMQLNRDQCLERTS